MPQPSVRNLTSRVYRHPTPRQLAASHPVPQKSMDGVSHPLTWPPAQERG